MSTSSTILGEMTLRRRWPVMVLLFSTTVISGCANNSARLNMSPCAGCDFQPINRFPVAECHNEPTLVKTQS